MPLKEGPKQIKQSGRSAKNSLAYLGVAPDSPANFKTYDKDPTINDYKNFEVGDEWENRTTKDVWKLVEKKRTGLNTAEGIWVKFIDGSGNVLSHLIDDDGNSVYANATDGINVVTNNATNDCGASVKFTSPVANTLNLNVTDASENTFIGKFAGNLTLTGNDNTALGQGTLSSLTTGDFNIAIGAGTLASNTTGSKNIAIGVQALGLNTTGVDNVAIGDNALTICESGQSNVAIGLNAMDSLVSGVSNVAIGTNALAKLTTDDHSIAIGTNALANYVTNLPAAKGQNIAIGNQALGTLTAQGNNTVVGTNTLTRLESGAGTNGGQNTFVGFNSAPGVTHMTYSTSIGYATIRNAGATTTSMSDDILIGSGSGWYWSDSESGNILIGSGGESGENNTIRLGQTPDIPNIGGGIHEFARQTRCFIQGIRDITPSVNDAKPVYIDSNGQLGTGGQSIAFFANLKDNLVNFTGDAESGPIIFEQEIFDLGSNYNHTTGIFTAPIEGIYYLHAVVDLTNITIGNRSYIKILTTNGAFHGLNKNTSAVVSVTGFTGTQLSVLAYMAIGDTARINIVSTGEVAKTQTVAGSVSSWPTGNAITFFEGHLVTPI